MRFFLNPRRVILYAHKNNENNNKKKRYQFSAFGAVCSVAVGGNI